MPSPEEAHPSDQTLEQYALDRLPEEQTAELEEHLLVCPACQDRLAETDAFIQATRQAAHNFMMLPPSRWALIGARLARWASHPAPVWAAAAALLLALVVLLPRLLLPPLQPAAPALTILLSATRGAEALALNSAPAGRPLRVIWDAAGLSEAACCRIEVVDARGGLLLGEELRGPAASAGLRLPGLSRGTYWIRLYALPPGQGLLREFGLRVE